MMVHRSWCEISLAAIRHNLRFLRTKIGPAPALMAMLKADAYGHGAEQLAPILRDHCQWLGCANVAEASRLREINITTPILLLSGFLLEEIETACLIGVSVTLSSLQEAKQASRVARSVSRPLKVHVKVDTGMGRLGCHPSEATDLIRYAETCPNLVLEGVYSHFSSADESKTFTRDQIRRFKQIEVPNGVLRHLCNSAGTLAFPEAHLDLVRPGLAIFGICPLRRFQSFLRPAMTWKGRVVRVREVPAGTSISYGATFTTRRPTQIATLAVGYGDGLARKLGNRGHVLISGHRCPIRGRVTMDQIVVEVPRRITVRKGSTATLLGKNGEETISAADMADWAETIPYEIWCQLTARVIRCYR